MSSIEYFTNGFISIFWDSRFKPNLYQNNNMDKKISAFIESKAEIQELLASQPDKKRKLYGFILTCCVDVKMNQLFEEFLENSEEGVKYCFIEQYQGMTPRQIAGYKRKLNNFSKIVYSKGIDEIKKILVEDGDIEEILELVFSNEKHYNNILKFLNRQILD
jgi:hypothetical protein